MAEPEIIIRPTDDGRVPMPGDAVRLTGDYCGVKTGSIGILGGQVGVPRAEYYVTFHPSTFRGRAHPYGLHPEFVSCSGGPAPFVRIDELTPTEETTRVHCWRWGRNGPGANCGVGFMTEVPVWEWKGQGR